MIDYNPHGKTSPYFTYEHAGKLIGVYGETDLERWTLRQRVQQEWRIATLRALIAPRIKLIHCATCRDMVEINMGHDIPKDDVLVKHEYEADRKRSWEVREVKIMPKHFTAKPRRVPRYALKPYTDDRTSPWHREQVSA